MESIQPVELLDLAALLEVIKISKGLVYKLMKKKKFPRPVKIGARSFWKRGDIDAWIEKQKAPKA